ncbi:T9SS type A sorting domain-containing protein [Moheibacter sp.]|uniref:T9SS type A sorting domain-containing protein n=1 Tax=Moheibacter sp. TaxID=1965316 RepID=UPI003C76FD7D
MKKITFLLGLIPFVLNAQNFEEVETVMKGFYYSAGDLADFDGDGFTDVVMNGAIDNNGDGNVYLTHNEIYKNNNGTLEFYADLGSNSTHLGDIKFIDYNNDGLADIISTGLSYNDIVNYQQYRFKNTGTGFELDGNLAGKIFGSMEVFDFNHDGKVDYALNGTQYVEGVGFTYDLDFYQNTGNGFEAQTAWLPGTQNGSFKIIDLNNDAHLDAIITGFNSDMEAVFHIYMNNDGVFELTQELPAVNSGKINFADFNADGFLDMVAVGQDSDYEVYLAYYINDGNGNFEVNQIENEGLEGGNVEVGDLNNDGYYDFIINGDDDNYDGQVKVFLYKPAEENFELALDTGIYNLGSQGTLKLFDYDNDSQLDILISGFDWADPDMPSLTKLFRNLSTDANLKPTAPTELSLQQEDNRLIFSWSGASDDKTPTESLRYEITVGSNSGEGDIAKYVVTTPFWFLDFDEVPANLYWSVKSIDASKLYSDASEEGELSSSEVNFAEEVQIYPNPAKDFVYIKTSKKIDSVEIYNVNGQRLNLELNHDQINVKQLPSGVYVLKIQIGNSWVSKKLMVR